MAASGAYPIPIVGSAPRLVAKPQQNKILEDVLECIIQLKSEFFDNHQPLTDDSVTLQRLCAKLEHLIQMGMRERSSILGRKKDYWDYFCDCLGSAKGSNDGIRYVKNLRENKTSLGRGRAFIRFCLVHQRLADAIQQCQVHEKTSLWFLPSSVLCNPKDAASLISALYDLNSMNFDLAPRGYDLDAAWPSFANRKVAPVGSWNIPISRRSSITSMDTISQASMSFNEAPEVGKLYKDLEAAQMAHGNAQEQLGVLQKEKEVVSQSAWASQGQVTVLEGQLAHCQDQCSRLQEQYRELDVNFVKLKLEKDHLEKLLSDEKKNGQEQESRRVQQLQGEEEVWKREMKEEGERRRKEIDKLRDELTAKSEEEESGMRRLQQYSQSLMDLMADLQLEPASAEDVVSNVGLIQSRIGELQSQMEDLQQNHDRVKEELDKRQQEISDVTQNQTVSANHVSSLESELVVKGQECDSYQSEILSLEKKIEIQCEEIKHSQAMNVELKDKEKDLKDLNQTLKENLPVVAQNLQENKMELAKYLQTISQKDELLAEAQTRMKELESNVGVKDKELEEMVKKMDGLKTELEGAVKEKEERLSFVVSELKAMETKCERFEKNADMLRHAGQALNEKMSLSEARVEMLTAKLKDEETKVTEMTASHKEMMAKLKENVEEKSNIERERNELKNLMDELTLEKTTMSRRVEELSEIVNEGEKKCQELQADLNSALAEVEDGKKELSVEKDRVLILMSDSDGVKKSEAEKCDEISNLLIQTKEMRREKEELSRILEKERNEWTIKSQEKEQETVVLKKKHQQDEENAVNLLKSKMAERDKGHGDVLSTLNTQVLLAVKQCQNILNLKAHETDNTDEVVGNGPSDFTDGEKLQEAVNTNVTSLNDIIQRFCESHEKMKEKCSQQENTFLTQLANVEEENKQLLKEMDTALEETRVIKSELLHASAQLDVSNSSLGAVSSENGSLQSKMATMIEEISRHESEKDQLRRDYSVLKADCERAEDEAQQKLSEKRQMEVRLEEVDGELEKVTSEKIRLEKTVEEFYSQTEFSHKVLEDSLVDSQNALEAVKAEKNDLEERCVALEEEKKELEDRLQTVEEESQTLKDALAQPPQSADVDESNDEVSSLKRTLEEEKARYELEIDTLQSEVSSLQFQLSSEYINQQTELQTSHSLEDMEAVVKRLETENEELRKSKEESQSHQNNMYHIQIQSQEETITHLERKIREIEKQSSQVIAAKEQMSLQLSELQRTSAAKIEERDKELEVLRSDNEGLKKHLLKLIKAKDNLWQKTDALVDERKRKASEKWQDNATVTHCGLCRAEFSLFLRKHHCRQCGQIFCWSCSDNWLDAAHSSKKARVCKTCFDRHNNPDDSLMATSLVENESEDDEDGEDSSTSSVRSYFHTMEDGKPCIKEITPQVAAALRAGANGDNGDADDDGADGVDGVFDSTTNETDEGKLKQRPMATPSMQTRDRLREADSIFGHAGDGSNGGDDNDDSVDDSVYQVVTQDDVTKTVSGYQTSKLPAASLPSNMSSSMILEADDLETGEVNRQNEVWIKPGKRFAVPINIGVLDGANTLTWEFTSHPKDIVFSINFCAANENGEASETTEEEEEIVSPCKCAAHKQTFRGDLVPKKPGIYTLIFDNTYSRMTSKKVHYHLEYKKPSH